MRHDVLVRPSILVPLLVLSFLLAGCSGGEDATGTAGSGDPTTTLGDPEPDGTPAPEPVLEAADCPDPSIPLDRFECAVLVVPEDRSAPSERQVELAVLQLSPSSGPVGGSPVVYLHGGPGASGVDSWATWLSLVDGLDRDLVIYDQRGAGRSTPRLECPEHDTAMLDVLSSARDWPDERDMVAEALSSCHERLRQRGVDLDQYDTRTSVEDLDDLRRALGTEAMSLVATSYGSRLALAYLGTNAARLESLVLDSVDVPGTGGPERDRELLPAALDRLFRSCLADDGCAEAHPDLAEELERAAARLDAEPVELSVTTPDQRAATVLVGGDELYAGLFAALYDTDLIPLIPTAIASLAAGDDSLLDAVGSRIGRSLSTNANGTLVSVNCADHGAAALESEAARRSAATDPGRARQVVLAGSDSFCSSWPVERADLSLDTASITSSDRAVPALVIAGELDPITPAEESRRTAEELDAQYLEIERGGHAPLLVNSCALEALAMFLADPSAVPPPCAEDPTPFR